MPMNDAEVTFCVNIPLISTFFLPFSWNLKLMNLINFQKKQTLKILKQLNNQFKD